MAKDDRRRMILVSVAGAAVTVLVVLSLTIGPTLIGCLANREGWAACLRQQSVERGLLPPGVPATAPAAADVTEGGPRPETGQAIEQVPVAASPLVVRAAGQAAGWVRAAGQGSAQGATAMRPLIGVADGSVRLAGEQAPRLTEVYRGAASLRRPLAGARAAGGWTSGRWDIAVADARALLVFVPPLARASVSGRSGADARDATQFARAGAQMVPPLHNARVEGRLQIGALPGQGARDALAGVAHVVLPRLRRATAHGTPHSDWRLRVATARTGGAASLPPPLVALGTAFGGGQPAAEPQRIRMASRLIWPMPRAATGRATAGRPGEQARSLALGLAQIVRPVPPATGSVSGTNEPLLVERADNSVTLPQMPPPPLPSPGRSPSEGPAAPEEAPSRSVRLSEAPGTVTTSVPPAPVPAERRSLPAALPETQRRIAAEYDVVRGDTLWGISRRAYGAGRHFRVIFDANRDVVTDPDLIFPGQRLAIPDSAGR
ncbi:MAG: LysM peptidoglycan-binding domain-containing protein [Devosia sp.]